MLSQASRDLIRYFVEAYPWRTALMVALLVVSGMAEGLGFFSLLPALEFVAGGGGAEPSVITQGFANVLGRVGIPLTLGSMLALVAVSITLKSTFLWLGMRQVGYTVAHVATELRLKLLRAIMHASWTHFTSQPTGHYSSAVAQDAHRASWAYRAACEAAGGLIRIAAYLSVAFIFSWKVSLAALAVSGFVLFVFRRFVALGREAGQQQVRVMRSLTKGLTEALPGIKPIKAMGREGLLLPLLERDAELLNQAQRKEVLASESLKSLREPVIVATICAGLYAVVEFASEPFASVMVLVLLFYRIVGTVNVLQLNAQAIAVGEEAFQSITEDIRRAEANRESKVGEERPPPLEVGIEFKGICKRYGSHLILDGVSFEIPAHQITALVGPSGAGKTTILDMLARLHEPTAGEILVDGIPLGHLDTERWRQGIGYVPQDVGLVHGSIMDNVTLGDEALTREQVEEALRRAGAWSFVSAHPDGLDRSVGEAGSMISGGQRQRILIARALVGKPRLLLLDEATTALDPATEAELCANLRSLSRRVTIVAVSHQRALQDLADQVLTVEDGLVSRAKVNESCRSLAADPVR